MEVEFETEVKYVISNKWNKICDWNRDGIFDESHRENESCNENGNLWKGK